LALPAALALLLALRALLAPWVWRISTAFGLTLTFLPSLLVLSFTTSLLPILLFPLLWLSIWALSSLPGRSSTPSRLSLLALLVILALPGRSRRFLTVFPRVENVSFASLLLGRTRRIPVPTRGLSSAGLCNLVIELIR
jgi:hypothetical protein